MSWNWQQPDWTKFRYDRDRIAPLEAEFLKQGGILIGAFQHLNDDARETITVEQLTDEAMSTSAIEGEVLDRESVRSSLCRQLGLRADPRRGGPREQGIAEMMAEVFRDPLSRLEHETLFRWHSMLVQGRADIRVAGGYRVHEEPMQVVSGRIDRPTVHFEAPPSSRVPSEMARFVDWFNETGISMPALSRAGIAHLYFESIHPFEDGNGRIGRAISERALAQALGQPSITMLSPEIEFRRKEYYEALRVASTRNEMTEWLLWFSEMALSAQRRTQSSIEFTIAKTRLLDGLRGSLNTRQERALLRVLQEGPAGFAGGLSSANYQSITGASPATAGRDLAELVGLGCLRKTGTGKGTRYWIVLKNSPGGRESR